MEQAASQAIFRNMYTVYVNNCGGINIGCDDFYQDVLPGVMLITSF